MDDLTFVNFDTPEADELTFVNSEDPVATPAKSIDSVSTVSEFSQVRKRHEQKNFFALFYKGKTIEELLAAYHEEGLTPEEKEWLRTEIFLQTYFLLPHALRESYPVNCSTFNDAMQNMSISVLNAIEKFDPSKGCTFVNYLVGYFKGAIAKTFRETNVVCVPTGRRKTTKVRTQGFSPDEVHTYNGVEYSENGWVGMSHCDFDEDLHNKQLVEWLEEALSRELGLLTEDERRVLILRYGLFKHPRLPYREIAKLREQEGRGHAFSRLSQIHNKAITKLRQFFQARQIEEY